MVNFFREIDTVVEAIADMNESQLKQAASFEELERILGE